MSALVIIAVIGFLFGAALIGYRCVFSDIGGKPEGAVDYLILIVFMAIGGAPIAFLSVLAASPIVAFVHRIDALERRCPSR